MTDWYKFVSYYLWIAPHIFLLAVLAILYKRHLHTKFPLFFAYTCYETGQFLLLLGIYKFAPGRAELYEYVFIATLAGSAALRFGLVQEVFNHVFHDFPRLESTASVWMRGLTVLLLAGAILSALYSQATGLDHLLAGVALLDRSVALIQVGLLLFLFLFAGMFGLARRDFEFGIALGFGVVATTDLAVWAMRLTGTELPFVRFLNFLSMGSYHVSVLVWLGYLLRVEKPATTAYYTVPELDRWSGELERFQ